MTYGAFIEFAFNNRHLFYAVLNKDYGLGIISKNKIIYVTKIINVDLQQTFVNMLKNNDDNTYIFFKIHEKMLINSIN